MHGDVGAALPSLGLPEGPLGGATDPGPARPKDGRHHDDTVVRVCCCALGLARQSGLKTVSTMHILFAVFAVYGWAFDHELYRRGTCRDAVLEELAGESVATAVGACPP